ncbi:MAG: FAD-dependent oxidoreductase, partial [Candidatus Aenigmarchaeota archaeon]|nr:FAD-dependent oxidoreductase [Candidatus Aenigmarchaeota archaeon]
AKEGEVISSALFANGVHQFGKHHKDDSPQGIFCANGQCAQCLVLADDLPVKGCITPIKSGMKIESLNNLPQLPADDSPVEEISEIQQIETDVLIIGGGPAGLSAAIELGKRGMKTIIADDKHELGGKLSLQTHNFFGSTVDCYAGMRGMEIGKLLAKQVQELSSVEVWLNSPVVGVFVDGKVGVVKNGNYNIVKPKNLLVSPGARERALAFPGCDLPGVYGAGAFQTLVNRDGIKCAQRIFIIGGGNVGLIVAYHALQAGIDVAGLVEAMPVCGGYKVHLDKIKRLGIPVFTSHTVKLARGNSHVEKVIITEIDKNFKGVPNTEKEFDVDTILVAVGLSPLNEISKKAKEFKIPTYVAGDADQIAEASAAIFTGKIIGYKILKDNGFDVEVPKEWEDIAEMLQSKSGKIKKFIPNPIQKNKVYPIIRCNQEIPCDPCEKSCPKNLIKLEGNKLTGCPEFNGECIGCMRCIASCPGLAITLVDRRGDNNKIAVVTLPWEMPEDIVKIGDEIKTKGFEGEFVGMGKVVDIKDSPLKDRRKLLSLEVPTNDAELVAGIQVREPETGKMPENIANMSDDTNIADMDDDVIICRCERITKKQILEHIKNGCSDFNSLKAALRVGMGPCGGKTCADLVYKIFREAGVNPEKIEHGTVRPFEQEVRLKAFLKGDEK